MKASSLMKSILILQLLFLPLSLSSPVPTHDVISVDRDIKRLQDSSSKFSIQIIDDLAEWEDAAEQLVEELIDSVTPSEQVFGIDGIVYNDQEITEAEGFPGEQDEDKEQEEAGNVSTGLQDEQTALADSLKDQLEAEDEDTSQILMDTLVNATAHNGVEYTPYDDLDFETEEDRISSEGEVTADEQFRNEEIFLSPGCDISGSASVKSNFVLLTLCVLSLFITNI